MVPWLNKRVDTEILAARISDHHSVANRITVRDSCRTSHSAACDMDRHAFAQHSRPQQLFEHH
jgi:hypothetical protein